jgi:hypothetical protein
VDWTKCFAAIARAFDIPVERAIFDGEVVVVKDGRTNFPEFQAQAALAAGRQQDMGFYARPARRKFLMPIAGKKPAKEASAKKPAARPQRKSA